MEGNGPATQAGRADCSGGKEAKEAFEASVRTSAGGASARGYDRFFDDEFLAIAPGRLPGSESRKWGGRN